MATVTVWASSVGANGLAAATTAAAAATTTTATTSATTTTTTTRTMATTISTTSTATTTTIDWPCKVQEREVARESPSWRSYYSILSSVVFRV